MSVRPSWDEKFQKTLKLRAQLDALNLEDPCDFERRVDPLCAEINALEFELMSVPITDTASALMRLTVSEVDLAYGQRTRAPIENRDFVAELMNWLQGEVKSPARGV